VAVGQVAIGFIFGLGQLATGFIAIGQLGIGKYVFAQIGFGEHVWSQKVADPEAVRFLGRWHRGFLHGGKQYSGFQALPLSP